MNKQNKIFIEACNGRKVPYTPLWIMRQAGRYLPEYRAIRKKYNFHEMMHTPDLMKEVTLQPIRRYDFDAAIMFSDILVIPESMGLNFQLIEKIGPVFKNPLNSNKKINSISYGDISYFKHIFDGIKKIRRELDNKKSLIGFTGAPWTIACYMVEGRPSKDYRHIRALIYNNPKAFHYLMEHLTESIIEYIRGQVNAGVDAVQIFDTNAGFLSREVFESFSFPYLKRIILAVNKLNVPSILFVKGGGNWLDLLKTSGANVLGLDWTINLNDAKKVVKNKISLQGNLDPSILLSSNNIIRKEVCKILKSYGNGYGHIFNLGHGITPDIPIEAVQTVVNTVREVSPNYK
ncbi:MAG: uroporphyrinogen decarboxylase [Candidatus Marinimicrobia bacterium]|nr:uroporphyrinogen decarboxylase [Candidatus Neomarinimicrobiota bacterium]|tara:strand:+ start:2149 stop:3189 length:1041 start_codon:yes stop_codon:yes gene_type:complete